MKVIEKRIICEDYNYVEGILELKVSGKKAIELKNEEQYSIDEILATKFIVSRKYIAPEVPEKINKNKVSTLHLPFEIPTCIDNENPKLWFKVRYDIIICDDDFVSDNGTLIVNRTNSVKEDITIFSTIILKAYGLKKNKREEKEVVTLYELFSKSEGKGKIEIFPLKEYYNVGEKVKIKAIPDENYNFLGWAGDFKEIDDNEIEIEVDKDFQFQAAFSEPNSYTGRSSSIYDSNSNDYTRLSNLNKEDNFDNSNEKEGCFSSLFSVFGIVFSIISYLFLFAIAIGIITSLINAFGWNTLWFVAIPLIFWLFSRISNLIPNLNILRSLLNILVVGFTIVALFNFFKSVKSYSYVPEPSPVKIPKTIEKINENSSINYAHVVEWEDYDKKYYKTKLIVNSDFVNFENITKEKIPNLKSEKEYNTLLNKIYSISDESLYHVYNALDSIKSANNISQLKFPEVIVSMIQHIPYYAILDKTCNPFSYQDETMRQLLMNNPCQGHVKHGIKTPAEFLKDLKGDCDSRTLLLYAVLKHYKYDVAIFGSSIYKHSILGINIPSINNGIYKIVDDKKYYLWETTNKGFQMGAIPKDISNTNYWQLNLK